MVEITSLIENPKDIIENAFSPDLYNNASLFVPDGTMDKYKACTGWKKFVWIEEGTPTGIKTTTKDSREKTIHYSIDGKPIAEPQKGVNIVRMSDGSVKKVVVK